MATAKAYTDESLPFEVFDLATIVGTISGGTPVDGTEADVGIAMFQAYTLDTSLYLKSSVVDKFVSDVNNCDKDIVVKMSMNGISHTLKPCDIVVHQDGNKILNFYLVTRGDDGVMKVFFELNFTVPADGLFIIGKAV